MSRHKSALSGQKSLPTATIQVLGDENAMSVSALILVEQECHYQNLYIKLIANWVDCSTTSMVCPDIISAVSKPYVVTHRGYLESISHHLLLE